QGICGGLPRIAGRGLACAIFLQQAQTKYAFSKTVNQGAGMRLAMIVSLLVLAVVLVVGVIGYWINKLNRFLKEFPAEKPNSRSETRARRSFKEGCAVNSRSVSRCCRSRALPRGLSSIRVSIRTVVRHRILSEVNSH